MPEALIPTEITTQFGLDLHHAEIQRDFLMVQPFFLSTGQGEFLLYRRRKNETTERLAADHALIAFLVEQGFPTHSPVRTITGHTWCSYDGYLYELYPLITSEPFEVGNRDQIASVGRVLGQYHALAGGYKPNLPKPALDYTPSLPGYLDIGARVSKIAQTLVDGHHAKPAVKKDVRKIAQSVYKQIAKFREERDLTWCTVHGDFQPAHVIFDSNGQAGLINWSGSHVFSRVLDVASALLKFVGRRTDADLPGQAGAILAWPRVDAFVHAYRESVRFTAAEGDLLRWVILTMRLNDALWYETDLRIKYGREIGLTRELAEWLDVNSDALGEMFTD